VPTRLPGLIDAHVHLRDPGPGDAETFETGTAAAAAGGFTAVLDMPNNLGEPTTTMARLREKIRLASGRTYCDIGFYIAATSSNSAELATTSRAAFGAKLYLDETTGSLVVDGLANVDVIFRAWPAERPLHVHAEDMRLAAVFALAYQQPRRIHVCHVSQAVEIKMIRRAKEQGLPVTCEVTPHHLFLNEQDARALGPYGLVRPPLRPQSDVDALWSNLDVVDIVATDHAPHTKSAKEAAAPAYGMPGLETALPLMLTAVARRRLTIDRVVELLSTGPARLLGVPRPRDSRIEVDLDERWTIDSRALLTRCGWTPFDGMQVFGRVKQVTVRGEVTFEDGTLNEASRSGRTIAPRLPPSSARHAKAVRVT
jgi:dihydroorotase